MLGLFTSLLGLGVAGAFCKAAAEKIGTHVCHKSSCVNIGTASPFIDLNVQPVSEGDTVRYACNLDGRYIALVENKKKHVRMDLEAETKEELEEKVRSFFKAWSIQGRKRSKL